MKQTPYEKRVRELEEQGCTTSDAQGVADAEVLQGKLPAHGSVFEPLTEEDEECQHEETENAHCIECGEFIFTYDMEHDSGDMER